MSTFDADHPRNGRGRFAAKRQSVPEAGLPSEADWRDQTVLVLGMPRSLGSVDGGMMLHGTPTVFQPGDILEPGRPGRFAQSPPDSVSITSDRKTAEYWGAGFVYEVEPIGHVDGHRVGFANRGLDIVLYEGRVASARIIRCL